ncbi:MAG: glycine cleavage T C-terminal barrel domain-containing protein [Phycisphaerales bacterium]
MATQSPMTDLYKDQHAALQPYGDPQRGLLVPMAFEHVELEYAAIRKGCALVDLPQSGTIEATGADRVGFLNNLLTQELKTLEPMASVRSFWLNRKGRIDADLRLMDDGQRLLMATDALVAGATAEALAEFVFAEDVQLRDATESLHRLALHGPRAAQALMAIADTDEHVALEPGRAMTVMVAGASVLVEREDSASEPGLVLTMPAEHARAVYERLAGVDGLRPCGWLAYNIARIEAGWPIFQIDFTGDNLPAETGVLHDRVSFTKGCYLGQEVVARMQSLGKPKQVLVSLRLAEGAQARLPEERALVYADAESDKTIGTVTSSTIAPMLSATPIALAQVRTAHAEAGTTLYVQAEGDRVAFTVQPSLASWPAPGVSSSASSSAPERQ